MMMMMMMRRSLDDLDRSEENLIYVVQSEPPIQPSLGYDLEGQSQSYGSVLLFCTE